MFGTGATFFVFNPVEFQHTVGVQQFGGAPYLACFHTFIVTLFRFKVKGGKNPPIDYFLLALFFK